MRSDDTRAERVTDHVGLQYGEKLDLAIYSKLIAWVLANSDGSMSLMVVHQSAIGTERNMNEEKSHVFEAMLVNYLAAKVL